MFTLLLILLFSSSLKGLSLELQQDAIFNEVKNLYHNQKLQKLDLENEQLVQSGPVIYERDRREVLEEGSGDGENLEIESPPEDSNNITKTDENKTEATTEDETTQENYNVTNEDNEKTGENGASDVTENTPESQNEDATKASEVNPLNVPDENVDTDEKNLNVSDTTAIGEDAELNPNIRRLQPPSNTDGDQLEEHRDHAEIIDDKKDKKDNETNQMRAGDQDKNENTAQSGAGNNILIILVVVVIVAGAGCFGYKYCKSKQKDSRSGDNPGTELKEIKVDQKNDTKQAPTTTAEMKPLLDNKNQTKTNQNESKESKGNEAKSGENAVNENTPCNGRNNEN